MTYDFSISPLPKKKIFEKGILLIAIYIKYNFAN